MIPKNILHAHYQEYARQPDVWVANMAATKRSIVEHIVQALDYHPLRDQRIAVLGASDRRYVSIHEDIFRDVFLQPVQVVTYDIDTEHLQNAGNIMGHDVTQPFPQAGFSVIFSHELLKFCTQHEQIQTLRNAYNALESGGISMHIVHEPSLYGTAELREWQYRVDPNQLLENLAKDGISGTLLRFRNESKVDWLAETCSLVFEKK